MSLVPRLPASAITVCWHCIKLARGRCGKRKRRLHFLSGALHNHAWQLHPVKFAAGLGWTFCPVPHLEVPGNTTEDFLREINQSKTWNARACIVDISGNKEAELGGACSANPCMLSAELFPTAL